MVALLLDGTVLVDGGDTGSAELYVPVGVSPPPAVAAIPTPSATPTPTTTPVPTPIPPQAGPVPPDARAWTVTVVNKSSQPTTLFVAEEDSSGMARLVGSVTPNVVQPGATVDVTFLLPANGWRDGGSSSTQDLTPVHCSPGPTFPWRARSASRRTGKRTG